MNNLLNNFVNYIKIAHPSVCQKVPLIKADDLENSKKSGYNDLVYIRLSDIVDYDEEKNLIITKENAYQITKYWGSKSAVKEHIYETISEITGIPRKVNLFKN